MSEATLWIALAACVVGGYFAACNIALKTFSRPRLAELLEPMGKADRVAAFADRAGQLQLLTATARTCMSLVVLLAMLDLFEQATDWSEPWKNYLAAFLVTGALVSVFVVAVPSSLARYRAEQLLARSMTALNICLVIFMPAVKVLHLLDPVVRRMSGADAEPADDDDKLTDEVMAVVEDHRGNGHVDHDQKEMIEAVFELSSITADQVMTPRTETEGIEADATLEEIKAHVLDKGHSRIPVYEEDLDHILGVLYVKDLIQYLGESEASSFDLRKVMRPAWLVPETKPIRELLGEFKARKIHMAILLDEYGGTAGLVSIEDILEELVGEIQDEYEPAGDEPTITRVDERTTDVDGRVRVDDLNDQLGMDLPEDEDYDTVGGFVFAELGHIPELGETFVFQNMKLTVTDAERTKVNRIRIERQGPTGGGHRTNGNGH